MDEQDDRWGWALSIGAGVALWSTIAVAGNRPEPWDTQMYWTAGYPLALLFSGVIGMLFPWRTWRWAFALMLAQLPVMLAGGSGFGLLPFGMVFLAILSLPAMLTARIGAWLRGWLDA